MAALAGALERISAEQCETSRDTRLALITRLAQLGSPAQVETLMPLLKDIDPDVADAAAGVIARWTGKAVEVETPHQRSSAIPTTGELAEAVRVVFEMDTGGKFDVMLNPVEAPLTRTRFLAAARAGYYNGLTFHRVVPNFVIQGGSPAANEYSGDTLYMRDEISSLSHVRGAVGISTRGRDTGDAQFFVNLVDNPRLDFEYTVFGLVQKPDDLDDILEGDVITGITFEKQDKSDR